MAKHYAIACFYERNSLYLFKNKDGKWEYPIIDFDPDNNFRYMDSDERLKEELKESLSMIVYFENIKPSELFIHKGDEHIVIEAYRFDYINITEYSFKKKYTECKLVPLEKLENTTNMESIHADINKQLAELYRNDWYPKKAIMSPEHGRAYCFNNVIFRRLFETWLSLEEARTGMPRVALREKFTFDVQTSESNLKKWLNGKGSPTEFETLHLIIDTFTKDIPPYELYNKAKCSWESLWYDPNKREDVKVYREPSGNMLRAFEAIVNEFEIKELTWLRDETYNGNGIFDDNHDYKLYFSLPIKNEILEHGYDITIVLNMLYKKKADGNYYGIDVREFLYISYGGDKKYIHNIEMSDIDVTAWNEKLKQILDACENDIDRCDESTKDVIHSYQQEDIRDEYHYYSLRKVRHKLMDYFGIDG